MDRRDELTDGDETGIQAEGRATQKPAEVPVPTAPRTSAQDFPRSLLRRIWTALIPWLAVLRDVLGFGSAEVPVPTVPSTSAQEIPLPLLRRIWMALIPWLAVPSMVLGFGSIYFQILTVYKAHVSGKPLSVVLASPGADDVFLLTLPMATAAIPLGLFGYWLCRREVARFEKELVYPRGRPVTIQARLWALIGVASGALGLILRAVIQTLI